MTEERANKILELFNKENISLLTPYINLLKLKKTDKLHYKCNICGEEYATTVSNILDNRRTAGICNRCSNEKNFIETLIRLYNKNPYTFLSRFTSNSQPLRVKCNDCGFEFEVKRAAILLCNHNFPKGKHPCKNCSKNRLKKNKPIEELENKLIDLFGECNYKFPFPEKYMGIYSKEPFLVICKKCNTEIYTLLNNIIHPDNGFHYCAVCNKSTGISKKEDEILDTVKSITNKEIIQNNRSILKNGLELDIYIPDLKLGIEFDGLYWHNEEFKGKDYHLEKTIAAEKENIHLIHIFEDEWRFKKDIVISKLKTLLNENTEKIYARKCIVKEISVKEKTEFLEKYHIQGSDKSQFQYGLFYNNELVSVMTFAKLRSALGNKKKIDGTYELSRFASSKNVIGGFSKLLKFVVSKHEEIKSIITYADRRWSYINKNVYKTNGFSLKQISKPSYWYYNGSLKRYHRYNFRKNVLKEKFPDLYDPNLTEHQIMDKTPYKRIWDCGNLVYEWKREEEINNKEKRKND